MVSSDVAYVHVYAHNFLYLFGVRELGATPKGTGEDPQLTSVITAVFIFITYCAFELAIKYCSI